jgi:molybdate-binding protein/transcriptional regulator with XRE-family HTH domain
MSDTKTVMHPVAARRAARGWPQAELARRAGIPRSSVSAIESRRLTPSVSAALALARALECSVEELFSGGASMSPPAEPQWAWAPRFEPCRYWEAEVNGSRLLYPIEGLSLNVIPHDGVWQGAVWRETDAAFSGATLVVACCDPAAGLLAGEYARASGLRLIVFPRGGAQALDLLKRGLVHVAGLHRSTPEQPERNLQTVRSELGGGFRLARVAQWQEGLALPAHTVARCSRTILRRARRWALREVGSAARECLDELCAQAAGRTVRTHTAVAEAVRGGWADAGVCVQVCAQEAGLSFVPVRAETLDFCFAAALQHDPRIQALLRLLRSRPYRRLIADLPGYDTRHMGETLAA